MKQAFAKLGEELSLHFEAEQKLAHQAGFDFSCHQLAQLYLLGELRFLENLLSLSNCLWFEGSLWHFRDFLKSWLIDAHILRLDMPMKAALQKHFAQP